MPLDGGLKHRPHSRFTITDVCVGFHFSAFAFALLLWLARICVCVGFFSVSSVAAFTLCVFDSWANRMHLAADSVHIYWMISISMLLLRTCECLMLVVVQKPIIISHFVGFISFPLFANLALVLHLPLKVLNLYDVVTSKWLILAANGIHDAKRMERTSEVSSFQTKPVQFQIVRLSFSHNIYSFGFGIVRYEV